MVSSTCSGNSSEFPASSSNCALQPEAGTAKANVKCPPFPGLAKPIAAISFDCGRQRIVQASDLAAGEAPLTCIDIRKRPGFKIMSWLASTRLSRP